MVAIVQGPGQYTYIFFRYIYIYTHIYTDIFFQIIGAIKTKSLREVK